MRDTLQLIVVRTEGLAKEKITIICSISNRFRIWVAKGFGKETLKKSHFFCSLTQS